MYVSITGNKTNQDVYIKYSYRKENGKTSSRIYKKLGKLNDLLDQFAGDKEKLMDWAKDQATMETELYKQKNIGWKIRMIEMRLKRDSKNNENLIRR